VGIIAGGFRIVDTASLTVTDAQLAGLVGVRFPLGIAVSPDGRTAYVSDTQIGEIQPVDLDQLKTLLPMINADDSGPFKVTINPAGTFLYGMSEGGCMIVPINLATRMFMRPPIVINCDPADLCATPDGRHLLIANRTALFAPGDSSLSVVDTATNKLVGHEMRLGLTDGSRVGGIALSPDGATTYLIRRNKDTKVGSLCSLPTADIFSGMSVS
jgi:DNA-binding beta-propeller fold protein YncE